MKKKLYRALLLLLVVTILVTTNAATTMAGTISLTNPVFNFDTILFVKHQYYPANQGVNTTTGYSEQHMCDQYFGFNGVPGGGLFMLNNAFSGSPTVTDVLANSYCTNGRYQGKKLPSTGAFLSPDLSYDGTQILFAYTDAKRNSWDVWNENTTYHIFKVNIDGTNLTQLTDGIYNDFDPCWLPDGRVTFISERRGGYGRCHQRIVPNYTLHTMNADGTDIRTISLHETNEWGPSVDNNGMIIYTRWDYVDRGATHMHSSWITSPDGLDARAISLNYPNSQSSPTLWRNLPLMQMSLRAIPNSNKIVGTAAPHHGQNYGPIIIIDPDMEDDDSLSTITKITPDAMFPESQTGSQTDLKYGTPYPLSEEYFLCVYDPNANTNGDNKRYGIYAIDDKGNKTQLYTDPNFSCLEPIPVRARPTPNAIPGSKTPIGTVPDSIVSVANIYDTLMPFPQGTNITQLRIWQVYPKTSFHANNPVVSYEGTESSWAGRGTRGLLGSVPVEADGSANFYLPAGKAVCFQAVDSSGTAVQTMRSDTYVIGGQSRLLCQGCHEPRQTAPEVGNSIPTAFTRAPSVITADAAPGARPMSFPRLIQPVLDSKCISCHNGAQTPDLRKGTPDTSTKWFQSYKNLRPYVFLFNTYYGGSNWDRTYPRTEPGKFGAKKSALYTKLQTGHGNLTADELHRFAIWLDSGIAPFFGDYTNIQQQLNGDQVEPSLN